MLYGGDKSNKTQREERLRPIPNRASGCFQTAKLSRLKPIPWTGREDPGPAWASNLIDSQEEFKGGLFNETWIPLLLRDCGGMGRPGMQAVPHTEATAPGKHPAGASV
jgi:hypothetical protein